MWLACCVGSDVVVTGCFEKVKHRHAVAVWGNNTQNVTHSFSLLQSVLCFFIFAYAVMLMTTQGPCQLGSSFKTACSKPHIVSKTTQLWPQHPHDGHMSSKNKETCCWLTALMTSRMGTVAQVLLTSLSGRDLALPAGRSPKSKQPDLLISTLKKKKKINMTLNWITSKRHYSDEICEAVVRTSIAGFSAMPTSTTFLANIFALAATSVSADAGQEQTLRTHW